MNIIKIISLQLLMTNYSNTLEAKDLLKYHNDLQSAIRSDEMTLFFNDSILHAIMIMSALLERALVKSQDCVCMYCGEFSLFRDKTKSKILQEKLNCSLNDLSPSEVTTWKQLDLCKNLNDALIKFLSSSGTSLEIIIAHDAETLFKESFWGTIQPYVKFGESKLKIYKLKSDVGLDHFVTTVDSYRVENSDTNKTALCCFNDKEYANVLIDNFKILLTLSQRIF